MYVPLLGLISQSLAPRCKEVEGWDISPKMVEAYDAEAQKSDVGRVKCRGVVIGHDQEARSPEKLFDVVVVRDFPPA